MAVFKASQILGNERLKQLKNDGVSNDEIVKLAKEEYKKQKAPKHNILNQDGFIPSLARGSANTAGRAIQLLDFTGESLGFDPVSDNTISKINKIQEDIEQKKQEVSQANITPERKAELDKLEQESATAKGVIENVGVGVKQMADVAMNPSEWTWQGSFENLIDPLNLISLGTGSLASKVGKTLIEKTIIGMGAGASEGAVVNSLGEYAIAKGANKSDEEANTIAMQSLGGGAFAGASFGGAGAFTTGAFGTKSIPKKNTAMSDILNNDLLKEDATPLKDEEVSQKLKEANANYESTEAKDIFLNNKFQHTYNNLPVVKATKENLPKVIKELVDVEIIDPGIAKQIENKSNAMLEHKDIIYADFKGWRENISQDIIDAINAKKINTLQVAEQKAASITTEQNKLTNELVQSGITEPTAIKAEINRTLIPTKEEMDLSKVINNNQPIENRLAGLRIREATLINMQEPTLEPQLLLTKLRNAGVDTELSNAVTQSILNKDIEILDSYINEKVTQDVDKSTKTLKESLNTRLEEDIPDESEWVRLTEEKVRQLQEEANRSKVFDPMSDGFETFENAVLNETNGRFKSIGDAVAGEGTNTQTIRKAFENIKQNIPLSEAQTRALEVVKRFMQYEADYKIKGVDDETTIKNKRDGKSSDTTRTENEPSNRSTEPRGEPDSKGSESSNEGVPSDNGGDTSTSNNLDGISNEPRELDGQSATRDIEGVISEVGANKVVQTKRGTGDFTSIATDIQNTTQQHKKTESIQDRISRRAKLSEKKKEYKRLVELGYTLDTKEGTLIKENERVNVPLEDTKLVEELANDFKSKEEHEVRYLKYEPLVDVINDITYEEGYQAHQGTSFSPERRAKSEIENYVQLLTDDYESLLKYAEDEEAKVRLDKEFIRYRAGMKKHKKDLLSKQSRIMSSMITGPANFPVAKMEKLNGYYHNALDKYIEYREKALRAIKNKFTDSGIIKSDDPEAIVKLTKKIQTLETNHQKMKDANRVLRNKKTTTDKKRLDLLELGFSEKATDALMKPDSMNTIGFASFSLTNNLAEIKRLKSRLTQIQRIEAKAKEVGSKNLEYVGAKVVENYEAKRVQVIMDDKPSSEIRTALKKRGFKWSPKNSAWQRSLNNNSMYHAKSVMDEFYAPKEKEISPAEKFGEELVKKVSEDMEQKFKVKIDEFETVGEC